MTDTERFTPGPWFATFRPGERVEITVEVLRTEPFPAERGVVIVAKIEGDDEEFSFWPRQLALGRRLPRPIGVGDKVRAEYEDGLWSVTAIHGEWAWCHRIAPRGDDAGARLPLSLLTLAEEGTP